MEPIVEATRPGFSSGIAAGPKHGEFLFGVNEIYGVSRGSPFTGRNSFTALLESSPPSTVELSVKESIPAKPSLPPFFPSNIALIDRASKFSTFVSADDSLECNSTLTASSTLKLDEVKQESLGSDLHLNSSSPVVSNQSLKPSRRKERKKKNKESKKNKKVVANESGEDGGQNLPYVHVRARRGQATDSHSLAERARRENINARMKLLQEMVPGCNKISGVSLVLDEIINHVRELQRQVEILSMELASVDPIIDFNLDALLAADQNGSSAGYSYPGMFSPFIWGDGQINGDRQQQYQQLWHFDELHHPNF